MRTIIQLTCILLLFAGCVKQQSSQAPEEETIVSLPNVDLHSAVVTDNLDVIRQHIASGSDLNVLEPSRSSAPLHTAAAMGKTEAATLLVDAGADLDYKNADGSTALITAAAFGQTEMAKLLIASGAGMDIQNNLGSTALHTAAFFCHTEIVEALLAKGADKTIKNKRDKTAYETVILPFEDMRPVYDAIGAGLKQLGIALDYEHIAATRPKVAEMLR